MLSIIYLSYTNNEYIFHITLKPLNSEFNTQKCNIWPYHILYLYNPFSSIITFKWYKIDVNVYNPRPYFIVGDSVSYSREQFTENVNIYS